MDKGTQPGRQAADLHRAWLDNLAGIGRELLQILLDSTVDLIFVKDLDGVYQICNTAFGAYVGRPVEEIVGWRDQDLFPQAETDAYTSLDRVVKETDQTYSVEEWVVYPNGDRRLVHTTKSPVHDQQGRVVGLIGICRDITERKSQEEQLRLLNQLSVELSASRDLDASFRLSLEAAILVGGMDSGGIYRVNERNGLDLVCHQGFGPEYVKRVGSYSADSAQAQYVAYNQPLYLTSETLQFAAHDVLQQERLLATALIPIAHDRKLVACLFLASHSRSQMLSTECTAMESVAQNLGSHLIRAWAENEVRASEHRLELFFSQSLDGFFFMMLDHPVAWNEHVDKEAQLEYVFGHQRLTRINQAMLDQYKAEAGDFLGKTPADFFEHDQEHGRAVWREFFDNGQLHVETREKRFDGSDMHVEGDYICLYDEQGRITGHFGIQRDITEQVEARRRLQASEGRYRILFEAIDSPLLLFGDLNEEGSRPVAEANRAASDLLGWGKEDLCRLSCRELLVGDHEPLHRSASETSKLDNLDLTMRRKDGQLLLLRANFCSLDWEGRPILLLALRERARG